MMENTTNAPLMAEELMIGNWVQRPEPLRNKLLDGDIIYWCVDITMLRDCEYYKENWAFEPIPLTEQWLEDFNFYDEGNGTWQNEIALYEGSEGYNYNASFFEHHNFVTIKYVHQLQNLYFALTATKLERGGV